MRPPGGALRGALRGACAAAFGPTAAEEKSALGGPGNDGANKLSSAPSFLLNIFGRGFRDYESLAPKIYLLGRLGKKKAARKLARAPGLGPGAAGRTPGFPPSVGPDSHRGLRSGPLTKRTTLLCPRVFFFLILVDDSRATNRWSGEKGIC